MPAIYLMIAGCLLYKKEGIPKYGKANISIEVKGYKAGNPIDQIWKPVCGS